MPSGLWPGGEDVCPRTSVLKVFATDFVRFFNSRPPAQKGGWKLNNTGRFQRESFSCALFQLTARASGRCFCFCPLSFSWPACSGASARPRRKSRFSPIKGEAFSTNTGTCNVTYTCVHPLPAVGGSISRFRHRKRHAFNGYSAAGYTGGVSTGSMSSFAFAANGLTIPLGLSESALTSTISMSDAGRLQASSLLEHQFIPPFDKHRLSSEIHNSSWAAATISALYQINSPLSLSMKEELAQWASGPALNPLA